MPICSMRMEHLAQVVEIHLESFSNFFLSFLGAGFLYTYYRGIIRYPKCIALVYLENGSVQGFVTGVMNPSDFYSKLLRKDAFRFGISALPACLKRPEIVPRLFRAVNKPMEVPKIDSAFELTSLAVRPLSQKKGFGRHLTAACISKVKKMGGSYIFLTTDAEKNESVNNFYLENGFEIQDTFYTREQRVMNLLSFHIR